MNTENNNLLREFIGRNEINLVIPFSYDLGEELPTSNKIATLDNIEDEVRLEIEKGIINEVEVSIDQLDFDNDYNLLMEVVDKIESLHYSVYISSAMVYINGDNGIIVNPINVYKEGGQTKHKCIYQACIQFIKWYNKQK